MYRIIFLVIFSSLLSANTVIHLKDGTTIEGDVVNVHRTVLQLADQQGIMIKLIAYVQTSDSTFVDAISNFYPRIPVEEISANSFRLDLSDLEVTAVDDSENKKQPLIRSYSFNFMLNTQRRHLLELNARIITHHNWCGEIGFSYGSESFPDAINAYNQKLQVEFSTESMALGFGNIMDINIGYLIADINFWLSSSNASIPVKGRIAAEGDSLLLITNVNEIVISPGLTFLKIDSGEFLHLMVGVRYFFDGIMLGDRGWYIEEKYYPVDKSQLKRGLSIHLGVGINLKVR